MKKFFLLAAAALVALTACTKIDDVTSTPDMKIGYQVANYATQTKAGNGSFLDELTSAPFSKQQSDVFFKSVAFINADDGNGGVEAPARFFTAATNQIETISYTSGDPAVWEPSHTYYWPKSPNSTLDFFSWYDLSATTSNAIANATFATNTYTLAWSGRTVALKDNIMYADPVWDQKANSATYKYNSVKEGVPTLFHHALAQVRFQFKQKTMSKVDTKNNTNSTFWVVKVKNITIPASKWVKTGSLSLTAAKSAAWTTPSNLIWTPGGEYWTSSDIFLADAAGTTGKELTDSAVTFNQDNQMSDGYITVLPQALGDDFLLNFDIEIVTKYGATSGGASGATLVSTETIHVKDFPSGGALVNNSGIQLNLMTTIGSYWKMNYKYTYIFEIDPETSTILYDPAVEAWQTDVNQTQTIPHVEP